MQLVLPIDETGSNERIGRPTREDRVFVNRSLRMDRVDAVGFDMDYTLVLYEQAEMNRQTVEATIPKLLARHWPAAIATMQPRHDFPIRGLLVDRKLGNIIKMDRHRYVKRAYHGYRELSTEERQTLYATERVRAFGGRFHFVDTLYALPEVSLYAAAIEALEAAGHDVDFEALFRDIRESVDLSHQDGTILDAILAEPERFVTRDPNLGAMIHKLRSAGKKLFLLTNSHADYTERMMTFLLGQESVRAGYTSWRRYFDLVVTAARKPTFFSGHAPFEEIEKGERVPAATFERGKLYAGGNLTALEQILGTSGDRILYVGDHIYGDVLRAKRDSAWRTVMVIQEMRDELAHFERAGSELARLDELDEHRQLVVDDMREHTERNRRLQRRLEESDVTEAMRNELEHARNHHKRAIDRLKRRLTHLEQEHEALEVAIAQSFHPYWGSIFKAGPEVSSFGDQVEEYACLYTSRASNLLQYSAMHRFKSPRERMPHEL